MTSISGKTNYLIIGSILEDKRAVTEGSKYKTAKEKDIKMISEQDFLDMISKRSENLSSSSSSTVNIKKSNIVSSSIAKPIINHSKTSNAQQLIDDRNNSMWVDRYKPQELNEVIGSTETVNKLSQWLSKWYDVHLKKTIKIPFSKENPGSKAVLLSGPPGIGKTTVATLVAKSFGFELLELNASDSRSKKSIHEQLADVVLTRAICSDGTMKKRLVIMDEVDGMGGSDRGGIPELIKVIKLSKSPVICICNDRQSQKIRSLANNCYDLRVKRPTKMQIAKRLIEVAGSEGLTVEQNAAEILVEQCGNDIRQALHCLQMWNAQSSVMRYSDIKDGIKRIEKDKVLRQSPFDAVLQILAGKRTDLQERYNCFFIDYSLIPLMVQENYIHSARAGSLRSMDEVTALETLSIAADAVSDMELAGASLRGQDQHWELLPTQGMLSIRVGSIINGFQAFPNFPSWLGKNSTTSKKNRLTQELVHHTTLAIGQGFTSIRLEYVPYLRNILLRPIILKGSEGVRETIEILEAYGLSKDDFSENMKDLQFIVEKDKILKDNFSSIDTQTKTALTKLYNQMDHRAQALVQEQSTKKKRRVNHDDDELGTIEDLDAAKVYVNSFNFYLINLLF
jgi:replication factor C subunit 1